MDRALRGPQTLPCTMDSKGGPDLCWPDRKTTARPAAAAKYDEGKRHAEQRRRRSRSQLPARNQPISVAGFLRGLGGLVARRRRIRALFAGAATGIAGF